MVNLLAGRRIVPELLQERFNPDSLYAALESLLEDTPARATQMAALAELRGRLRTSSGHTSIERVRDAVLAALQPVNTGVDRANIPAVQKGNR
jgi:lipid-A-disaccharide synthase